MKIYDDKDYHIIIRPYHTYALLILGSYCGWFNTANTITFFLNQSHHFGFGTLARTHNNFIEDTKHLVWVNCSTVQPLSCYFLMPVTQP